MKLKTIIIMIFALLLISLIFTTGCTTAQSTEMYPAISDQEKGFLESDLYIYIDPETGVNYFAMYGVYHAFMCPRYHADGSLYVSEVME